MNLLLRLPTDEQSLRPRLLLLLGQSFSLGIMVGLVFVSASTLFLTDFGSAFLPYVYISMALLGALVSYGSARAQAVWTLPQVAITTMTLVFLFFVTGWLARTTTGARWVSFVLMGSYPLLQQIGFVILGWQAGRLLDVRQIKRLFPHVVTGFVVGFITSGMLMPLLLTLLHTIENVLLVMALAALAILILIIVVGRRFPDAFRLERARTQRQASKPLPQLLRKPLARGIFIYYLLLAMLIQLTEFLLLAQAETRYDTEAAMAQFFSIFAVVLRVTDLLFLLLIAAFFLRRFGLKAGLLANPLVLSLNFALMLGAGLSLGASSAGFFFLVTLARVMTITLADGTSRTSVNAIYQALPAQERTLVQTAAEGIGGPLAVGAVGVGLLLLTAFPALTLLHLALFTFLLVVLWALNSLGVYRNYATTVLQTIKRRALKDVELTLTDEVSVAAVNRLLQSDQVGEARLALDMLETAEHPSFPVRVLALAGRSQPEIQVEALWRIEQHRLRDALPLVENLVAEAQDSLVQGAALQTLCALAEADAVQQVTPYLQGEEEAIRRGALVGLLRYGGISGIMAAAPYLDRVQQSTSAADRALAAAIIGSVERPDFYEPLLTLLQDETQEVRQAALEAAAQVRHPRLLPALVDNLCDAATRSAALAALLAYGPAVLPLVAAALEGETGHSVADVARLVRLCGQIGGPDALALLWQHVQHPHAEIQEQVVRALGRLGFQAGAAERPVIGQSLQQQAGYAATLLAVQRDIGTDEAVSALQGALQEEVERVRRRLFDLLSLLYDRQAIVRVAEQVAGEEKRTQALAVEMLDITLSSEEKALVFPLVEPNLTLEQRLKRLPQSLRAPAGEPDAWLADIIANRSGLWSESWLRTCALYAVGKLGLTSRREFQEVIEEAAKKQNSIARETAVWAL
jgi:AAA family ATP:ADP antiporter